MIKLSDGLIVIWLAAPTYMYLQNPEGIKRE